MPIYEYVCDCNFELETIQGIGAEAPSCLKCGGAMRKKPSPIGLIRIKWDGIRQHTKDYKEGYRKEYLKDTNREAWRGGIIDHNEPQSTELKL